MPGLEGAADTTWPVESPKPVKVERKVVSDDPDQYVSTSYVERQNLSLRMGSRRFTRLINGFSKKLDNHVAAVALYVCHYNLCRTHEALRTTPAKAVGVADRAWTIRQLVGAPSGERNGNLGMGGNFDSICHSE
jgi:hypothetical protein